MVDITQAVQANSNQLNAVDIQGVEPVITVRDVIVKVESGKPTIWIYYHGDNNRPWRVSTGMGRMIQLGWGSESDNWIGKSIQIFCNPDVLYAGKKVGGIQIKAMSDISDRGLTGVLTINRQKREPFFISYLNMERPQYPQDKFDAGLPSMAKAMQEGTMSLQQVIAQCQKTGDLTENQLAALQQHAPVDIDEEHNQ